MPLGFEMQVHTSCFPAQTLLLFCIPVLLLLVVLVELLEKDSLGFHEGGLVAPALWTVPLALGLGGQLDAVEVEPLVGAEVVVASHHLTERHLQIAMVISIKS